MPARAAAFGTGVVALAPAAPAPGAHVLVIGLAHGHRVARAAPTGLGEHARDIGLMAGSALTVLPIRAALHLRPGRPIEGIIAGDLRD